MNLVRKEHEHASHAKLSRLWSQWPTVLHGPTIDDMLLQVKDALNHCPALRWGQLPGSSPKENGHILNMRGAHIAVAYPELR